jgi:hypothetical protein
VAGLMAIDIGTSNIKAGYRLGDETELWRHGPTPQTPRAILASVTQLYASRDAAALAISSFRRAIVISDDVMVLARDSPRHCVLPSDHAPGGCNVRDPLSSVHRWALDHSRQPATLDSWLAKRMSGHSVIAESMAWLTGGWDTESCRWVPEILSKLGVDEKNMPQVMTSPRMYGSLMLPILGDHEATMVAAASVLDDVCLLECGTAMALLVSLPQFDRRKVGVQSPYRAGYSEHIDAYLALRLRGGIAPLPDWIPSHYPGMDFADELLNILELLQDSCTLTLCGGNSAAVADYIATIAPERSLSLAPELCPADGAMDLLQRVRQEEDAGC